MLTAIRGFVVGPETYIRTTSPVLPETFAGKFEHGEGIPRCVNHHGVFDDFVFDRFVIAAKGREFHCDRDSA
jgi:hypothetical protein